MVTYVPVHMINNKCPSRSVNEPSLPLSSNLHLLKELAATQYIISEGANTCLDRATAGLVEKPWSLSFKLLRTHINSQQNAYINA